MEKKIAFDTATTTFHVFVALCDNKYQGIIPVPPAIGNGQDPNSNLYWGCDAGVRTYFKKSSEWTLVRRYKLDGIRLERLVFRHRRKKYYLVADAYDGQYIKQCTIDFLRSCAGQIKDTLHIQGTIVGINGNAKLTAYIGHDGLMDFRLADDTLHDALTSYMDGAPVEAIRNNAAKAYNRNQKCGEKAARNLLVSGW